MATGGASAPPPMVSVESLRNLRDGKDTDKTRCVLSGLPQSGKGTILQALSKGDRSVHEMGNQKFKTRSLHTDFMQIIAWSMAVGLPVDPYWVDYHAERASGIIWVLDASNPGAFDEARVQLFKLLSNDKFQGMPLAIFANKSDVSGAASLVKVNELLEIHEVKGRNVKAFSTSAKTGEGIQAGLEWLFAQKWSHA